jgi:CHAD domain-containing protein
MPKKDFSETIEKRFKKVDRLLPALAVDFDPGQIHELRVEIKKLKALFRLIKSAHHKRNRPRIPAALKKVYRQLGQIRNLQLHLELLDAYEKEKMLPSGYRSLLDEALERDMTTARTHLSAPRLMPSDGDPKNGRFQVEVRGGEIRKYYFDKTEEVIQSIQGDRSLQNIHHLRKVLKDLQYNKDLLKSGLKHFNHRRVEAMTRLIGRYVDAWNSLHFVRHYARLLRPEDRIHAKQLHDWIGAEKLKALRQLKKALPAFERFMLRSAKNA